MLADGRALGDKLHAVGLEGGLEQRQVHRLTQFAAEPVQAFGQLPTVKLVDAVAGLEFELVHRGFEVARDEADQPAAVLEGGFVGVTPTGLGRLRGREC